MRENYYKEKRINLYNEYRKKEIDKYLGICIGNNNYYFENIITILILKELIQLLGIIEAQQGAAAELAFGLVFMFYAICPRILYTEPSHAQPPRRLNRRLLGGSVSIGNETWV